MNSSDWIWAVWSKMQQNDDKTGKSSRVVGRKRLVIWSPLHHTANNINNHTHSDSYFHAPTRGLWLGMSYIHIFPSNNNKKIHKNYRTQKSLYSLLSIFIYSSKYSLIYYPASPFWDTVSDKHSMTASHSPIQAAEDGGHAHHHVGNRQSVGCIFACKLLDLQSCGPIAQKQLVGALEETWDHKRAAVSSCLSQLGGLCSGFKRLTLKAEWDRVVVAAGGVPIPSFLSWCWMWHLKFAYQTHSKPGT